MSSKSNEITVGAYLFQRLHQFGIRGVHGVPGDFNLVLLDLLGENDLYWVGNCNELNAGYAADGYARIKGMSALITTFGVGELSTLAAVAGSFSEHVPVVHIVGVPNTASQKQHLLLHHTLGNGDFRVFSDMSKNISTAHTLLDEHVDCAAEIDRVLAACWEKAHPVYISLPTNIVLHKVDGSRLNKPIPVDLHPNPEDVEQEVVDQILDLMYRSKNTVILVDACAVRHRVLDELHEFIEKTKLPTFVTPMGKGGVNETHNTFGGVYVGDVSRTEVKEAVEGAELILFIGGLMSDFNSGGFTFRIPHHKTVEFHSDSMKVRYSEFPGITMKYVIQRLLKAVDVSRVRATLPPPLDNIIPSDSSSSEITHAWMWPLLGQWLKELDVIITETGTSNFGILDTRFPADVIAISQVLWGCIGYSVGACQGAALAVKEQNQDRRIILFVGDGSLQLTAQEISTMIRNKLTPIIFVLNNEGYTIERMINGPHASYNDVQPWKHTELLNIFSADPKKSKTYQVRTTLEMEDLLKDKEFASGKRIELVEVFMPQLDVPRALKSMAQTAARLNAA